MKKIGKNAFALFLAGVMALMPVGESMAAGNGAADQDAYVMTIEEITEDTEDTQPEVGNAGTADTDTEEGAETEETAPKDDDATGTEDGTEDKSGSEGEDAADDKSESENGKETEDESGSDDGKETEDETDAEDEDKSEDGDESEAEDGEGSEAEDEDEIEDELKVVDEEELEDEDEEETETEFPGLKNSTLSSKQLADKADLASHLSDIENLVEGRDYTAGELVFLADTEEEAEEVAAAYGGELARYNEGVGVVSLPETKSVTDAVKAAATSKEVVLPPAWPNYIYKAYTETEETAMESEVMEAAADEMYTDEAVYSQAALSYNDPYLAPTDANYQWQHAMVGSATAWNAGYTGSGIKIAIIDSGVSAHSDLNIIGNYSYVTSYYGDTDTSPSDLNGHGTHVAGLAAAKANNGVCGAGIAPDAEIINIRVLGKDGNGSGDWIMSGINKAVSEGADIINLSLGSNMYDGPYAQVVKRAYEAGVVVFAAASNDGSKAKAYPAAYSGAYAVGAVQQNGERIYFSNYGSWVKFSAPGYMLWSTSNTNASGGVIMSGTSQATPVVCGTAAVVLSANPSIKSQTGKARVDALISKMKKGTISGKGGAAGIVSLPKALGIPVSTAAPAAPVFSEKTGKKFTTEPASIEISAVSKADTIYYSTDGKAPTYKNGVLSANAQLYTGAISIGGSAKVTVQAIAVNSCGKVSKTAKAVYSFAPVASSISITGQNVLLKTKSTTLKANVTPSYAANKKVKWSSSAENEVKVDQKGKVTATAQAVDGKTYTITAVSTDNQAVYGTFTITVKETAKIKTVAFKDSTGKVQKSDTVTRGNENAVYEDLTTLLQVTNQDGTAGSISDVDFSSSNTKVATVDNGGRVTAIGAGKAVITATANDGSGKKASFTLTVKQYVTSLTVNGLSQISNGTSVKMTATVNADATTKSVKWSISPEGQGVTVNAGGTVKAAGTATAGSYTVTAVAKDGSEISGSKVITVSKNAITKIKLSQTKGTIFRKAGNNGFATSMQITADITAQGGSSAAVEFTSSNPGVATVRSNGTTATITATGKTAGTTTITCKAIDGSNKSATCKVTVVNPASKLTIASPAKCASTYDGTGQVSGAYVGAGKKIQLSAVFEEEFGAISSKGVEWSTSDKDLATVTSKGKVSVNKDAVGKTVVITAKASDNENMKASYAILITKSITKLRIARGTYIPIEVDPNRYWLDLDEGQGGYSSALAYNGAWATNANGANYVYPFVAIEVANPDILSASWGNYADEIVLWANKNGETTVTLKALDGSGTSVKYVVKITGIR